MIIRKIVDTFYNLSREHKLVRSFAYGNISKKKGTGEQNYISVLLEDPIYIQTSEPLQGQVPVQVNFDITCLPQAFDNLNVRKLDEVECQNVCHTIALSFISKIRWDNKDITKITYNGLKVDGYSFLTLRHWGDDDAAGVRCTLNLLVDRDIQLCDIDEHFDPDKKFDLDALLTDINTDHPVSCDATFDYKLSKFSL